jgi:hypothetical protein
MSDKDIQRLMDLAKEELLKPCTKEEALQQLIDAGIFDKDGNYTEPYKALAEFSHRKI